MDIIDRVIKEIKSKKLITKNDRLILGCSGGPDSVFLLEVLLRMREEFNLTLTLVHINHLFRGEDADRDENFVKKLGKQHNIQVFVKRKSMENMAKDNKITLEEAGREIRYSFFDEVTEKVNGNKIVLAHNLDDQIETFLFRLIRGSSIEGLQGISEKRDNVIRPINNVYKSDIMEYLDGNDIEYMLDYTNFENDYTRNSIRLDLIPFIEKRYNPKFKEKIKNFMGEIKEINKIIEPDYSLYIDEKNIIDVEKLLNVESEYIRGKIINYYLNTNNISVSRKKINGILSILNLGGTKKIKLNKDYTLIKEYAKIFLSKELKEEKVLENKELIIPGEIEFDDYIITAKQMENKEDILKNKDDFITNLNVGDILVIRSRRAGDRILPMGMDHYKKVKNIMIDLKIPKEKRENIPIITYKDEIVWIGGIVKSKKFNFEKQKQNIVLRIRRK